MKIAVVARLDAGASALLREELSGLDVVWAMRTGPTSGWQDEFAFCDVIFGNVPASWVQHLTALKWLQLESIGFEQYSEVAPEIKFRRVQLTNLRGQFTYPVAETALAGTLALMRSLDQLLPAQTERRWANSEIRPSTTCLHGKEVLILGAGAIGQELRHLFSAFDCRVRSFARSGAIAELRTFVELDAALSSAKVVANCLPGTADTELLIDGTRISSMDPSAIFVNVGRGSVIDEEALASALTAGKLGGAVLDVTAIEPLPRESPLWSTPRTILTQHTGGGYGEELIDKANRFLRNLTRWREALPLQNPVDWERGY